MSGGSLNYLCYKEINDLFTWNSVLDMETVEHLLIQKGYIDIARDVRRLIEYIKTAENRVGVLFENLKDVFHAVEWYESADIGEDSLQKALEKYRGEQ